VNSRLRGIQSFENGQTGHFFAIFLKELTQLKLIQDRLFKPLLDYDYIIRFRVFSLSTIMPNQINMVCLITEQINLEVYSNLNDF